MALCPQSTSHYLNQCWPRVISPYGVTRPQWVKFIWNRSGPTHPSSWMTFSMAFWFIKAHELYEVSVIVFQWLSFPCQIHASIKWPCANLLPFLGSWMPLSQYTRDGDLFFNANNPWVSIANTHQGETHRYIIFSIQWVIWSSMIFDKGLLFSTVLWFYQYNIFIAEWLFGENLCKFKMFPF